MNELEIFYDKVAKVAYDLFEKRGKVHGHDMADWLKAEMLVKSKYENEPGEKPTAVKARKNSKAIK